jgi:glycosyltransferase involved in cell wall biosynthesis
VPDRLLIVSPVRNEAAHIERVARAVAAQTRPPDAWVVVDDGSDDDTRAILRSLEPEIPFMLVVAAPERHPVGRQRDRLAAAAAPRAFNAGLACADAGSYTHVGKLDGDVELPPQYFEQLLDRFAQDPVLGIACGDLVEPHGTGWKRIRIPEHHVHGALKLYSRACFEAIGGVQERLGWDTIDETYARLYAFRTRSFADLVAVHHRPWASADGRLRGCARHGTCAFIARYGPGWVALRSLKIATTRPLGLAGLAFLFGYLRAAVLSVPRVEDDEFGCFVRREHRRRIRRSLRLARTPEGL